MTVKSIRLKWLALAFASAVIAAGSGCASLGSYAGGKVRPYAPDTQGRSPWNWRSTSVTTAGNTGDPDGNAATNSFVRVLRKGDRVTISLMGIPQPEEISNVINDLGFVTLPLIGSIKIEGLGCGQAEKNIKGAYINQQYYKTIDVIVVAQEGEFFVRGEVKKEGVFLISGDITLVQGIIMAGGYTDFAKKSEVKIIRGRETTVFDAEKIEKRETEDPLLRSGDIVVVPRRLL